MPLVPEQPGTSQPKANPMRVRVVIEYDYQGDETTAAAAAAAERLEWTTGNVGMSVVDVLGDVLGCEDPNDLFTITVA